MKLAFFSDVHGNSIALEAVLADSARHGVDGMVVVGDHAAIGPEPAATIERLQSLDNAVFTRGNTDRYTTSHDLPFPTSEEAKKEPELIDLCLEVKASFSWTRGFVTAQGHFDWLANLPLEHRITLPDGTRLLAVHASPGTDDGPGARPDMSQASLQERFHTAEADIVIVGHTHHAMDRHVGDLRIVNLGSVSNPFGPDLRASYVILQANKQDYQLEHHVVDYDHQAVIAAIHASQHPSGHYIISFQRGEQAAVQPHHEHLVFDSLRH
nr:phosphodiesterase, MJ0936 family [uncultured bacterium]